VKATRYTKDPWLKVEAGKVKANIYVLATVDGADVGLVGFTTDTQVKSVEPTKRTGHMRNHILEADDLTELPSSDRIQQL